jgi:DNA-directed RNA polymerase I subunit RPA2
LLVDAQQIGIVSQQQALAYLGGKFRSVLKLPENLSDAEVGEILIKDFIFVHLESFEDKFNLMILMLEKLYALAKGEIRPESLDVLSTQEFLLPGQIYLMLLREKIEEAMDQVKMRV